MRKLYDQKQDQENAARLNGMVQAIYNCAIREATENASYTQYKYMIRTSDEFFTPKRVAEMVKRLKTLFPDCSVCKEVDPERAHLFYITVDWS
jgi:hypothetical protein